MSVKHPKNSKIFSCSDKTELYLIAMEFPHNFGFARDYLIKECSKGKLSGKTCGHIRYLLESKFGKCDDLSKYYDDPPEIEED